MEVTKIKQKQKLKKHRDVLTSGKNTEKYNKEKKKARDPTNSIQRGTKMDESLQEKKASSPTRRQTLQIV